MHISTCQKSMLVRMLQNIKMTCFICPGTYSYVNFFYVRLRLTRKFFIKTIKNSYELVWNNDRFDINVRELDINKKA